MANLRTGTQLKPPLLDGTWTVWSPVDEGPGAYALIPADDEARAMGVKYAVVRATFPRNAAEPLLKFIRTDPAIEGLLP